MICIYYPRANKQKIDDGAGNDHVVVVLVVLVAVFRKIPLLLVWEANWT